MSTGLTCADPLLNRSGDQLAVVHGSREIAGQSIFELSRVSDQLHIWEGLHHLYLPAQEQGYPATALARSLARRLEPMQKVLELGCGNGADAAFLSHCGHAVTGTDFSEYAIDTAREKYEGHNLVFKKQDLREPLAFDEAEFDAVYARLSLHYFPDAVTRAIVSEIGRILAPGGQFLFMCKSTHDSLYGRGEHIAPRTFCFEGHIRHFFDIEYARDLLTLDGYFDIRQLRNVERSVYGASSSVIICLARRTTGYRQPRLF